MSKKRNNWIKLKDEYLASDFVSVNDFLRSKKIDEKSGNVKRQTRGWSEEKKKLDEEISKEVKEKTKIKKVDRATVFIEDSFKTGDKLLKKLNTIIPFVATAKDINECSKAFKNIVETNVSLSFILNSDEETTNKTINTMIKALDMKIEDIYDDEDEEDGEDLNES